MGATQSNSNIHQEQNQTVINQSTVNIVNQQLNSMVANAVIKDAQNCSAALGLSQNIELENISVEGDIVINSNQTQQATVNFDCVQASTVRNEVANEMISQIMAQLETSTSADILNQLDTLADQKTSSELGGSPFTQSSSNVEGIQNYVQVSQTNKNIENVVKNAIEVSFTSDTLKECINKVIASQNFKAKGLTSSKGGAVLTINQDQAATMIASCIQNSDVGNQITNKVLGYLDITTKDDSQTKIEASNTASVTQSTTSKGISDIISSVGDALAAMLAALGLSIAGPFVLVSSLSSSFYLCCCCCCLILMLVMMMGAGGMGGLGDEEIPGGEMMDTISYDNVMSERAYDQPPTYQESMRTIDPSPLSSIVEPVMESPYSRMPPNSTYESPYNRVL